MKQILHFLTRSTFVVLCLSLVVIAFQSVPIADDYCFKSMVDQDSFTGFISSYYMNWSGRLTSTAMLALLFKNIGLEQFYIVSIFWAALYVGLILGLARACERLKLLPVNYWTWANGLVIAFGFPLSRMLSETVYWPTGGSVYIASYAWLALVLALVAEVAARGQVSRIKAILMPILAFSAALALETNAIVLTAILGLLTIDGLRRKRLGGFWIGMLFGTLAGLILLVRAPGNQVRLKATGATSLAPSLANWPQNFAYVVSERGGSFVEPLFAALLVALLFVFLRDPGLEERPDRRRAVVILLTGAVGALTFFFSLFGSIVPPRTYSLLVMLLVLLGLLLFLGPLTRLRKGAGGEMPALGVLLVINIYLLSFVTLEAVKARDVRQELESRLQAIQADPARKKWVFPHVISTPSRLIHFDDLDVKAEHWKNACFVNYLKLEEARTE